MCCIASFGQVLRYVLLVLLDHHRNQAMLELWVAYLKYANKLYGPTPKSNIYIYMRVWDIVRCSRQPQGVLCLDETLNKDIASISRKAYAVVVEQRVCRHYAELNAPGAWCAANTAHEEHTHIITTLLAPLRCG